MPRVGSRHSLVILDTEIVRPGGFFTKMCDPMENTALDAAEDRVISQAWGLWKRCTNGWAPLEYHNCLTKGNNCSMVLLDFRAFRTPKGVHICFPRWCAQDGEISFFSDTHHKENIIRLPYPVFVCASSAKLHLCGMHCDKNLWNKDSASVCLLTGYETGGVRMVSKIEEMSQHISAESRKTFLENPFRPRVRGSMESTFRNDVRSLENVMEQSEHISNIPFAELAATMKPTHTMMSTKHEYLSSAVIKFLKIFSEERFEREMRRNEDMNKTVQTNITRYMTRKYQRKQLPNAVEMLTVVSNRRYTEYSFPKVVLNKEQRRGLAMHYANKCLCFWYVIRTRTPLGRREVNAFPFDEFLLSALDVFENGLVLSSHEHKYEITIVQEDMLLKTLPMTIRSSEEFEKKSSSKKRRRSKSVTRVKKCIREAIRDAVYDHRMCPELLRPDSIDYASISDLDFYRLTKAVRKNSSPLKKKK